MTVQMPGTPVTRVRHGGAAVRLSPDLCLLCCHGARVNAWDGVPLQVFCWSWAPLVVVGAVMHRAELSAVKV